MSAQRRRGEMEKIMKIAIMSFPGSPSHGAALQMYALYTTIRRMGHESVILNYMPADLYEQYHKTSQKTIKSTIINIVSNIIIPSSEKAFKEFESSLDKIPKEVLTDFNELSDVTADCDRIVVGSDQVWNMDITYHDYSFFLDFCHDKIKKVAYAPSFGNDDIYENEKERITELLSEFSFLSAREKKGCEIINELTGREVPMVCDPTFLLSKEEWRKIAKKPKYKSPYVLYYTIKSSPELYKKALLFAEERNLKLIKIGGRLREYFNAKNPSVFGVGPAEFLGLLDNAEYVFTNSFHGTALSIIMHKNFYVEYSSNTNVRLINLIDAVNLRECVVNKAEDSVKNTVKINYREVDKLLSPLVMESTKYIERFLKQDE